MHVLRIKGKLLSFLHPTGSQWEVHERRVYSFLYICMFQKLLKLVGLLDRKGLPLVMRGGGKEWELYAKPACTATCMSSHITAIQPVM